MDIATADRLVQLRKSNGLSQESLAALLGVSRQAVSKWERAEASPDTDNLIALAGIYNLTLDQLLDTSKDKYILENGTNEKDEKNESTINKIKEKGKEYLNSALYPEIANKMFKFPYPILVVIVYLVSCFLLRAISIDAWGLFALIFLTIPMYYMIAAACRTTTKKGFLFLMPVPIAVVTVYLFSGMVFGLWGPAAILFLAIPLYYWYVIFYVKGKKKNDK